MKKKEPKYVTDQDLTIFINAMIKIHKDLVKRLDNVDENVQTILNIFEIIIKQRENEKKTSSSKSNEGTGSRIRNRGRTPKKI